jgi:hypothetical protein
MAGQLTFLPFVALACALVFCVSFFAMLYATLLVVVRAGAGVNLAEERELSWGERAGRANSRFGQFLVADELRPLRRFYFGAWLATIGSGGLGFLFLFLAGRTG